MLRKAPFGATDRMEKPVLMAAVLAAGKASRFGAPKQLAEFRGKPLFMWALSAALEARLSKVLLITGYYADQIVRHVPKNPLLEIIKNNDAKDGLGTSVAKAAFRAEELGADGLVFLLADMPLIRSETVAEVAKLTQCPTGGVAATDVGGGKWGHPVGFHRRYFHALQAIQGDTGARELVNGLLRELKLTPVEPSTNRDIDVPEDLEGVSRQGR